MTILGEIPWPFPGIDFLLRCPGRPEFQHWHRWPVGHFNRGRAPVRRPEADLLVGGSGEFHRPRLNVLIVVWVEHFVLKPSTQYHTGWETVEWYPSTIHRPGWYTQWKFSVRMEGPGGVFAWNVGGIFLGGKRNVGGIFGWLMEWVECFEWNCDFGRAGARGALEWRWHFALEFGRWMECFWAVFGWHFCARN